MQRQLITAVVSLSIGSALLLGGWCCQQSRQPVITAALPEIGRRPGTIPLPSAPVRCEKPGHIVPALDRSQATMEPAGATNRGTPTPAASVVPPVPTLVIPEGQGKHPTHSSILAYMPEYQVPGAGWVQIKPEELVLKRVAPANDGEVDEPATRKHAVVYDTDVAAFHGSDTATFLVEVVSVRGLQPESRYRVRYERNLPPTQAEHDDDRRRWEERRSRELIGEFVVANDQDNVSISLSASSSIFRRSALPRGETQTLPLSG